MKPTKPILKAGYVPSWKQHPNHLARRFAQIRKEQRAQAQVDLAAEHERILKVRVIGGR